MLADFQRHFWSVPKAVYAHTLWLDFFTISPSTVNTQCVTPRELNKFNFPAIEYADNWSAQEVQQIAALRGVRVDRLSARRLLMTRFPRRDSA